MLIFSSLAAVPDTAEVQWTLLARYRESEDDACGCKPNSIERCNPGITCLFSVVPVSGPKRVDARLRSADIGHHAVCDPPARRAWYRLSCLFAEGEAGDSILNTG